MLRRLALGAFCLGFGLLCTAPVAGGDSHRERCVAASNCAGEPWASFRGLAAGQNWRLKGVCRARGYCGGGWENGRASAKSGSRVSDERPLQEPRVRRRRHVTLDKGRLLGHPWRARSYSDRRGQPCYETVTETSGVELFGGECGAARRGFIPILLSQSGNGSSRGNVVLVITPTVVHRVRLRFGGRTNKNVWPKRIPLRLADDAGVRAAFRYKAFARPGRFCLRQHVEFDSRGHVFYRSERYPPCRQQWPG